MGNTIRATAQHLVGQTTGGEKLFSEPELREEFTALVLDYTPRQLAKFSGATPEGARHWLDGSRCANLANAVNIARHIPSVADWIMQKMGHSRAVQAQSYDAWIQGLYAIAAGSGPDAERARWAIAQIGHREPRDTATIEMFPRRRG